MKARNVTDKLIPKESGVFIIRCPDCCKGTVEGGGSCKGCDGTGRLIIQS